MNRAKNIPGEWLAEIERWCSTLRATGLSPDTVYLRRAHVAQMARALPGSSPHAVAADDVLVWLGRQVWKPETRRSRRSSLRAFFRFIGRHQVAEAFPRVKPQKPHPMPLPEPALREGLEASDERARLIIRMGAELGLRRAEISRVNRDDLMAGADGWSLLVHGKGDKPRLVPVTDALAAVLRLRCCPGTGWLFPGDYAGTGHISPAWVGKLASRALPGKWTLHKARHRFATVVHEETHDLVIVMELLGHASLATTQAYVATTQRRLRAAVELAAA